MRFWFETAKARAGILSLILSLLVALTCFSFSAYADEIGDEESAGTIQNESLDTDSSNREADKAPVRGAVDPALAFPEDVNANAVSDDGDRVTASSGDGCQIMTEGVSGNDSLAAEPNADAQSLNAPDSSGSSSNEDLAEGVTAPSGTTQPAPARTAPARAAKAPATGWSLEGVEVSDASPDLGQSVTIAPKVKGDASKLSFKYVWEQGNWAKWGVLAPMQGGAASYTYRVPVAGPLTFYVDATDGSRSETKTAAVNVADWSASLSAPSLSVAPDSVRLEARASHGSEAGLEYKFVWEKQDWAEWGVARKFQASSSASWAPSEPGDYTVWLDARDRYGTVRHDTARVTVKPAGWWGVSGVKLSASPKLGRELTVKPVLVGKAPAGLSYKYVWTRPGWAEWGVLAPMEKGAASYTYALDKSGDLEWYVDVSDGRSTRTASASARVAPEEWSLSGLSASFGADGTATLSPKASGQTAFLTYKWVWEQGGWAKWGVAKPFSKASTYFFKKDSAQYGIYCDVMDSSGAVRTVHMKITDAMWNSSVAVDKERVNVGEYATFSASSTSKNFQQVKFVWETNNWNPWAVFQPTSKAKTAKWAPRNAGDYTIYCDFFFADGSTCTKTVTVTAIGKVYAQLNGVDIAHYQSDLDVKNFDADFVIVKATNYTSEAYSNKYSSFFNATTSAALSSDKLLGLYHFPDSKSSPEVQADFFVSKVKPYIGKAILALDWENDSNNDNLSLGPNWAKRWLDRVYQKTGVMPLIYMSKSVENEYNWSSVASTYKLWLARYMNKNMNTGYLERPSGLTTSGGKSVLSYWAEPTLYQYSSTGNVGGYKNALDLDAFYGTRTDWMQLARVVG
jgi:GH25 family lysozyme M1 (1,4-beta-N-acetylmuramidase)